MTDKAQKRFHISRSGLYLARARAAAQIINRLDDIVDVYDLGCGFGDLRQFLNKRVYHPYDLQPLIPDAEVIDLAVACPQPASPERSVATILGLLEYLEAEAVRQLLRRCVKRFRYVVVAYNGAPDRRAATIRARRAAGWASHLTLEQLVRLLERGARSVQQVWKDRYQTMFLARHF